MGKLLNWNLPVCDPDFAPYPSCEAVRIGNRTEHGFAVAVSGQNIATALKVAERIHSGAKWVNCHDPIEPRVGFNGAKGNLTHPETAFDAKSVSFQHGDTPGPGPGTAGRSAS